MPDLIQQLIPLALGVVVSPLLIAAIIAVLLSPRARANGIVYTVTALLVILAFTVIAALTTGGAGSRTDSGDNGTIVLVLGIVLSLSFLALAVASWASRPRNGKAATAPGWLSAIDSMSAVKTAGLAALMTATDAKNISLELNAGAHIGAAGLGVGIALLVSLLFAIVASLGLIVPTALAASGSVVVQKALSSMKAALIAHNAVIMTVVFSLLFVVQAGNVLRLVLK